MPCWNACRIPNRHPTHRKIAHGGVHPLDGFQKARDRIAVLAALNLAFDLADRSMADLRARREIQETSLSLLPASADPQLTALRERLDRALGDDGQLI